MKTLLTSAALVLAMALPGQAQTIRDLCVTVSDTISTVQQARNAGMFSASYFNNEVRKASFPTVMENMLVAMITVTYSSPPGPIEATRAASFQFCMETLR